MATPVVSGVVTLLLELRNDLTPYQVKYAIEKTGVLVNDIKEKQGSGKIWVPKILPEPDEMCPWCKAESPESHSGTCLASCPGNCDKSFMSALRCLLKAII